MNNKSLKLIGVVCLCVICGVLAFRACTKSAKLGANLLPAEGAGRRMAMETIKLAKGTEAVFILTHDPLLHPRYATQIASFMDTLKNEKSGLSPKIEVIPEGRLSPERSGIPTALYHELRKKTGADCIWVSMVGAPWIEGVDQLRQGEAIPRVIALDVPPGSEKALFAEDMLNVAIQYRSANSKKAKQKAKTADEYFEKYYVVKRKP